MLRTHSTPAQKPQRHGYSVSDETKVNAMFTAAAIPRGSTETMPPPRVTRSITAQLSRQSVAPEIDELDPLTDLDDPVTPSKSASPRRKLPVGTSSRNKLPVGASSSHAR